MNLFNLLGLRDQCALEVPGLDAEWNVTCYVSSVSRSARIDPDILEAGKPGPESLRDVFLLFVYQ
jgi:hypothetical protein